MVAGLGLAGVAGCAGYTTWYVAEYPLTHHGFPPTTSATLPPVTAVLGAAAGSARTRRRRAREHAGPVPAR